MNIVFRVDASRQMGTGHVMRCLTLADGLHARGHRCFFICRRQPGDMTDVIRQRGYSVNELSEPEIGFGIEATARPDLPAHWRWLGCDWQADAQQTRDALPAEPIDWLVVDHYAIDARWHNALRPYASHFMVVDDLADRDLNCDILLDQNYYSDMASRYVGHIPATCQTFLGPGYVLLRPEFPRARRDLRKRPGTVRRILVFFGGSDITNQTRNVLDAVSRLNLADIDIDVIAGWSNPYREQLEAVSANMANVTLHGHVSNMAELIAAADLGIGAGGSAIWERCYLGLPSITVAFADNQVRAAEDLASLGAIRYIGRCDAFTFGEYERAIRNMIASPDELQRLTHASLDLVSSGAEVIADAMTELAENVTVGD